MLQSSRLEDHVKTIGIDQLLFTKSSFEHRRMKNIKKIYQHAGKFDDQKNLKDVIDADMVYNPEGVTYNSHNAPMTSTPVKKPSTSKSLYLFTNTLDVKPKTSKRRIVGAKSKHISIKVGNNLWTKRKKRKGHSKINEQI